MQQRINPLKVLMEKHNISTLNIHGTKLLVYYLFQGKVDKGGVEYYKHPWKLCDDVAMSNTRYQEKLVALLHDVLQDIPNVSVADLEELYSKNVVNCVCILTKKRFQSYEDYIEEVSRSPIASNVKLLDLKHNMDITRLKSLSLKDFSRLKKYHWAYNYLMSKINA